MHIPRSLAELSSEEIYRLEKEGINLKEVAMRANFSKVKEESASDDSDSDEIDSDSGEEDEKKEDGEKPALVEGAENVEGLEVVAEEGEEKKGRTKGISEMSKEEKKEHKIKIKAENKEKRLTKTPKHVKRRAENKNKK